MNHKIHWTASLSNGETVYEERGDYTTIPGELSPWQRLLKHAQEIGATVTSVALWAPDGRRWNLPSAGKTPKFHALQNAPKPTEYRFFRKMAGDVTRSGSTQDATIAGEEIYHVSEAKYDNGRALQVWVNNETGTSWSVLL